MRLDEKNFLQFWLNKGDSPASKSQYDHAIGQTMGILKRAPEPAKPVIKRALVHMNVARQLEKLNQPKVASYVMKVAMVNVKKVLAKEPVEIPPPIELSPEFNKAAGRAMGLARRAADEDKPLAREAIAYFNLARTVAGLGYDRVYHLLVELGENRLAMIRPPKNVDRDWEPAPRTEIDMHNRLRPQRPAPPKNDPNPIRRTWNNTMHRIASKLDNYGINL